MFSHLRYFAVGCLLLILLGALFLGFYIAEVKRSELIEQQRAAVSATFNSFSKTIWQRYAPSIVPDATSAQRPNFETETRLFFEGQNLAKVTIFSPDVSRLYFANNSQYAATDQEVRVPLFDLETVQSGTSVVRLLKDAYLRQGTAPNEKHMLVQMVIPISRTGGAPEALAEVYVDVSAQWAKAKQIQYIVVGTMVSTFCLMLGLLLFTAYRAESIISKQHEVNLELIAAASQAEAQSHDKSQFLANVSHELRTPLNAIIGFSEILRTDIKDTLQKVYQDYIEDINASGRHLLSLINDILDYSKAEAGKLEVQWAETDATKIIRNSLRMVMPRAETGQVMLIEDIPTHHLVVVTDAKKLKQVLLNLLSNAVKFTPAGGEVRCQAWVNVTTGALTITVKDTGIGIAPKDISKAMTPFGQVASSLSRKYEGTGLGLPLSKKFIESMGGEFRITSELGVGTEVTVTIPKSPPNWEITQEDATTAPAEPAAAPVKESHVA